MNKRSFVFFLFALTQILRAENFGQGDLDVSLRHFYFSLGFILAANGDFNGDGKDDICMQETDDKYALILGGSLPKQANLISISRTQILLPVPSNHGSVGPIPPFFLDINGDGMDDLFVPTRSDSSILATTVIYVVYGTSTIPSLIDLSDASDLMIISPFMVFRGTRYAKGDFDGDEKEDVVVSGGFIDAPFSASFLILGRSVQGKNRINLTDGVSAVRFQKPNSFLGEQTSMGDLNGPTFRILKMRFA